MLVYFQAIALFVLFGLFHTICAQQKFKEYLSRFIGEWFEKYCWRFIYCCISIYLYFELALPFIFTHLPQEQIFIWPNVISSSFAVIYIIAQVGFTLVLVNLDFLNYFGFRQLFAGLRALLGYDELINSQLPPLKTTYFYGMSRHPLYFFVILMLLPSANTLAGGMSLLLLVAYLIIGLPIEEKKLIKQYGDEYLRYQETTSMFIPFLKLHKRKLW